MFLQNNGFEPLVFQLGSECFTESAPLFGHTGLMFDTAKEVKDRLKVHDNIKLLNHEQ